MKSTVLTTKRNRNSYVKVEDGVLKGELSGYLFCGGLIAATPERLPQTTGCLEIYDNEIADAQKCDHPYP